jgi:tetratricopeptide (TPR) repeat protein
MRFEMASFFNSPKFQASLKKYEDMVNNHVPAYFEGDELTDIAEYYASSKRVEQANKVVEFGLEIHPDDVDLLIFKARSFVIKSETEEARRILSLITDQNDREVKFLMFDILIEEGDEKEAIKVMDELAAEEEYSMEVMVDIMQAYVDNDMTDEAKEWYEKIDKAYGVDELIRSRKRCRSAFCDYYLTAHDNERCIPLLQQMVDETPYCGALWDDLARCYMELGNQAKAMEAVDFALAIDENDCDALELKANCFRLSGNVKACIEMLERAVKTGKQFPFIDLQLAKTYQDIREYEKVLEACEPILKREEEVTHFMARDQLNGLLAIANLATNHVEKGIEYLRRVQGFFSNAISTHIVTGHCALVCDQPDVAKEELGKAIETSYMIHDNCIYETLFEVASLYFDYNQQEEASKVYKQLIRKFPDDSRMILYLAMYSFAVVEQKDWFFHCFFRIREELPELYQEFGHIDTVKNETFNELLLKVKDDVNNGKINPKDYLTIPEE